MKKFFLFLLFIAGLVYFYFWYVRGINLLLQEEDSLQLQPYTSFATRLPPKDGTVPREEPSWQSAAPMPTARTEVSAAAINGVIYVVGGQDAFARTLATVEAFDVERNVWSIVAPLPKPLYRASALALGGKLYVFGGHQGLAASPSDAMYIYDPGLNAWSQGPNMPEPVGSAAVVYDGENIRVLGGAVAGGTADTHFVYSMSEGIWTRGESLLTSREGHAAGVIDGNILVVGGKQGSLAYNLNSLDVFRPSDRHWERWENMPTRRSGIGAVVHEGRLYVFGGEAPTVTFDAAESYDPQARKWEKHDPMPTPRHGAGVAVSGGKIFVIGGGQRPGLSVSDLNEVFVP